MGNGVSKNLPKYLKFGVFGLWIQKAKSAGSTELIYLQNGHFILQLGFLFCWKSQFVDNFHGDFSSAFTMNTWSRKRKQSCPNARCVYFELKWDYFINYLFINYYLINWRSVYRPLLVRSSDSPP